MGSLPIKLKKVDKLCIFEFEPDWGWHFKLQSFCYYEFSESIILELFRPHYYLQHIKKWKISMKLTLHENQHFRKNAQRKYHMFLFFCNWRKYHIFRKTKSKENIISDIFRNKSIEQGVYKRNWWNNKILYHADESYRIALTTVILLYI